MFKKGRKLMAFLLTLVVVASLVYDGGYASWLAQAASPDAQAETVSEEDSGTSDPSDGNEVEDPSQENGSQEENGSDEEQESSDKEDQNTEDPDGDQDSTENDGSEENDSTTGEVPPENGDSDANGTQSGTSSDTPTGTPEPTEPADPTTTPEATTAPEENEVQEIERQTLYPDAADGSKITLEGMMPKGAYATASAVSVDIAGQEVLAAYDITIYDANGAVYQPADGAIKVEITNAAVEQAKAEEKELNVYHMEDANDTPEKVNAEPVSDAGVMFQAEKFSIYAVTTSPHYTQTYVFVDKNGNEISRQILSDAEKLVRPKTPESGDAHEKFTGWFRADGSKFTDEDFNKTAQELNNGNSLNENTTGDKNAITLTAGYVTVYFVYYMNRLKPEDPWQVIVTQTYEPDETINTDGVEIETGSEEVLVGWKLEDGTPVTDQTQITGDMTLYPILDIVKWLEYETYGGTIMEPTAIAPDEVTVKPADPIRKGYDFRGWYTDDTFTQEFPFGNLLKENTTIYAKWIPAKTNYTVMYWKQKMKPTADGEKYDYAGSRTDEALTGTEVSATKEDIEKDKTDDEYKGFKYVSSSQNVSVAADGSTVIDVFYDRVVMTFNFYEKYDFRNGYSGLVVSMSGLYGSSLADNNATWPTEVDDKEVRWGYNSDEGKKTVTTFLGRFVYPSSVSGTTVNFYLLTDESTAVTFKHYVEKLDGGWELRDTIQGGFGQFNLSKKYDGFDAKEFRAQYILDKDVPDGFTVNEDRWTDWRTGTKIPENMSAAEIRHYREEYEFNYVNGNDGPIESAKKMVKYEAPLDSYGTLVPNRPADLKEKEYYQFEGWYADPQFNSKFIFVDQKMPSNAVTVYAKWAPKQVVVTYDYNDGERKPVSTEPFEAGNPTTRPDDPTREGYEFAGWETLDGGAFNFNTPITDNITLKAKWIGKDGHTITYKSGREDVQESFSDPTYYVADSKAKVQAIQEAWGWKEPAENQGFLCWVDEEGNEYYPGDEFIMPNENVTLTAKWAEGRKTKLIYDSNGGIGDRKEVPILTPNERTTISEDADSLEYTREGFYFVGWSTTREGNELLQKGDPVYVDTENQDANILYAQWSQEVSVKVTKIVSGSMGESSKDFSFVITSSNSEWNNHSFTLKAGEEKVFTGLKVGESFTVTETTYSSDGYKTYVTVDGGEQSESVVGAISSLTAKPNKQEGETDHVIAFENARNVVPPMGITDNMLPFAAMILAGLGAGVVFFLPRRRRQ